MLSLLLFSLLFRLLLLLLEEEVDPAGIRAAATAIISKYTAATVDLRR